jgi:glyoxylase-like metal-dependent hydrolase (beta-lactamase superfamily II)
VTPGTARPPDLRSVGRGLHLLETEVEAFDVRAAVLVGAERAVVWDTLAHPSQMAQVRRLVGEVPITVVYSHADWDHAWGTCGVGEDLEAVVAHQAAATRFATDVPAELEARLGADPEAWSAVRLAPPTTTFTDELTLDLGGVMLRLHALPGHTPDCIVGFVPEWGVLLAGDTVETPLPVVNDGGAVGEWIEGLERWGDDAAVTSVIPAHGRIGGRELIGETVAYLRSLLAGTVMDPGAVPAFYSKTHEENVRNMRAQGG